MAFNQNQKKKKERTGKNVFPSGSQIKKTVTQNNAGGKDGELNGPSQSGARFVRWLSDVGAALVLWLL